MCKVLLLVVSLLVVSCRAKSQEPLIPSESTQKAEHSIFLPTPTPILPVTRIIPFSADMSGSIDETGGVHKGDIYPGDNRANAADFEGFISFDVSNIPEDANISFAKIYFRDCQVNGFPFSDTQYGLGKLHVEIMDYGELDPSDYLGNITSEPLVDLGEDWGRLCTVEGIDVLPAFEGRHLIDRQYLQLRLAFDASNGDEVRDDVVLIDPYLIVEYTEE